MSNQPRLQSYCVINSRPTFPHALFQVCTPFMPIPARPDGIHRSLTPKAGLSRKLDSPLLDDDLDDLRNSIFHLLAAEIFIYGAEGWMRDACSRSSLSAVNAYLYFVETYAPYRYIRSHTAPHLRCRIAPQEQVSHSPSPHLTSQPHSRL